MANSYSLKPFIPFFVFSLIHFYYCYTMELFQKGVSKVLLMPALVVAYYFVCSKVDFKIILIFFFHWWGDIFFIPDSTYYYAVFCFWVGDIINAVLYYNKLTKFNLSHFIFGLIIVCPIVIYYGSFNLTYHIEFFLLCIFYGYITPLSLMVIFSMMCFFEKKNCNNFMFMVGNILFIFSDLNVIWVSFADRYYLDSLIIMVTYVIAQMFIINWYIVNEDKIIVEKVKKNI